MPTKSSCRPFARLLLRAAAVAAFLVADSKPAAAQSTAMIRGVVRDIQGGVLPGADVRLSKPLSGFERASVTDGDGSFQLGNIPFDTYELRVEFSGFAAHRRQLDLRSTVPVDIEIALELDAQTTSVTVSPEPVLLDTTSAGTRNQVSMARIELLPAAVGSRGLESVLVSFPGFAQNANGAIHPRGAHNQMTYLIDGLPISDQLTGAFANALDAGVVQTVELMTSNIPAEFGGKVSGVAVITSRSGREVDRPLAGDMTASVAGFNTWQGAIQAGGTRRQVGYFGSLTAMRTDRFLDQVSLDNLHNGGAFGRGFIRADFQPTAQNILRINAMGGRSTFDVANLRSQHAAGQDQRQSLTDAAAWASYLRTIASHSTFEATAGYRTTNATLTGSSGDTPVTASQDRDLSTFTVATRYSFVGGNHQMRAGLDVQRFPIREHFTMGITDPGFNAPDSDRFNDALLPYDLTRGGRLFLFDAEETGRTVSGFLQSTVRWRSATLALGLRYDDYSFLVDGRQLQPRIGVAYQLPGSSTVVRASYNRNYQTPPNENLLLSSSETASTLAPASVREALGGTYQPIRPEQQNVYEVGVQQAVGSLGSLDVSVYRKNSRDQQDNNNFFDTGIIFPTTLAAIRVTGAEARLGFRQHRGISGTFSMTTGWATSTPPFTGGLFLGQDAVDLLSSGPFAIDHDQRLSLHGSIQYDAPGPMWFGGSVRYDSGLVSNPSDPAAVAADPDFFDLLPYVNLDAEVPRVRPRTIVDVAAGFDVKSAMDRRTWSIQAQVTNVTNRTALYNFQSVFVGTRIVQPRTLALRVKRYF
jgi:hypothetical protein